MYQVATKNRADRSLAVRKPQAAGFLSLRSPHTSPLIQRKAACACGGGCPRCQVAALLQPKLLISTPGNPFEVEADWVAEAVLAAPEPAGGLASEAGHTARVQRAAAGEEPTAVAPPIVQEVLRAPGEPLDPGACAFMEPRFGRDFGEVRVHTDDEASRTAQQLGARAYAVGTHVGFASDEYSPKSREGRWLLAHELAHVAQQEASNSAPLLQRKLTVEDPKVNIPNPGGKGAVQTNAKTIEDYLKTLCPEGAASVKVDPGSGAVSIDKTFCSPVALPKGIAGAPSPAPAMTSKFKTGCTCICDLTASTHDWKIEVNDVDWPGTVFDDNPGSETPGTGSGGTVTAPSPNSPKLWGAVTAAGKTLDIDPWLVLGHELCGHGWLGDRGEHGPDVTPKRGEGGHQKTVERENLLRAEHGIDLRGTFKYPYCGESYWRDKTAPGKVNWSSYLSICEAWRAAYNKKMGTKYKISDKIP